jgi:hypothetical protein
MLNLSCQVIVRDIVGVERKKRKRATRSSQSRASQAIKMLIHAPLIMAVCELHMPTLPPFIPAASARLHLL